MIKRILVGLGDTPFNSVAIQRATELGDLHQAQLTGVTVVDTSKLAKVGPVLAGAGAYAQRMREKKQQVTSEGIEQAITAFKEHCRTQKVVCRRIEPFKKIINIPIKRAIGIKMIGFTGQIDCGLLSLR